MRRTGRGSAMKGGFPRVLVSGVSCGPNPSPGVGVARSLRGAFPGAELVAVDYSNGCSGLHWGDFDDVRINRSWDELDLDLLAAQLVAELDAGALYLPGLDLEAMVLRRLIGPHVRLLAPPEESFAAAQKPHIVAHRGLPVGIPPTIPGDAARWELHRFARRHDWNPWVKGPHYEAIRTRSWTELESAVRVLQRTWGAGAFLQADVSGHEESVAFAAYGGVLLDAVYMKKRQTTDQGKTWAGEVVSVPEDLLRPLESTVRELRWSGGAELEMIVDSCEQRWLIDWNPRFPAWIHGATIAGRNLPAALVTAATGEPAVRSESLSSEFTRVVVEVPVRDTHRLPPSAEVVPRRANVSKHPSGMPDLAKRLAADERRADDHAIAPCTVSLGRSEVDGLEAVRLALDAHWPVTPKHCLLDNLARARFVRFADLVSSASTSRLRVRIAYSTKTNPDPRLLAHARAVGFLGEAISQSEVHRLLDAGFTASQLVLNGPGKFWPALRSSGVPFHAVFADSPAEFVHLLESGVRAHYIGVRLRAPDSRSRFGIPVEDFRSFGELMDVLAALEPAQALGIHFHLASSSVGVGGWLHLHEGVLGWCDAIQQALGAPVKCLDLGGGWFPDDWDNELSPRLAELADTASAALPHLEEVILEPGKALTQPVGVLVTRVLETRPAHVGGPSEVVVDGSIAELPEARAYPHRLLWRCSTSGEWLLLADGASRVMGRLCMEDDILREGCHLPPGLSPGDLIAFADAGAYDRSMSYAFGFGISTPEDHESHQRLLE